MYICIYVYMYICIYVYMYICVYIYICIYVYMYICMYMYVHVSQAKVRLSFEKNVYTYIHTCMHACKHTYSGLTVACDLHNYPAATVYNIQPCVPRRAWVVVQLRRSRRSSHALALSQDGLSLSLSLSVFPGAPYLFADLLYRLLKYPSHPRPKRR